MKIMMKWIINNEKSNDEMKVIMKWSNEIWNNEEVMKDNDNEGEDEENNDNENENEILTMKMNNEKKNDNNNEMKW